MKTIAICLLLLAVVFQAGVYYQQKMELQSVNEQLNATLQTIQIGKTKDLYRSLVKPTCTTDRTIPEKIPFGYDAQMHLRWRNSPGRVTEN